MDTAAAKALSYQTLSEDGLVDLFCALGLLLVGIGWWLNLVVLSAAGPAALVMMWRVARRRISKPRMGEVTLHADSQMQISRNLLWASLLGALGVGIFIYFATVETETPNLALRQLVPALPTVIIGVMTVLGWLLLRATRYLIYAMGLLAAGAVVFIMGYEPHVGFFLGAFLPLFGGLLVFSGFLRANPVLDA